LGQHDLELVLGLDGLGRGLALVSLELGDVGLGLSLGGRWRLLCGVVDEVVDRATLKVLAKLLDFPDQLVRACLYCQHVC
jgi:hypothetical protein